jgi:ribose/xylose/arabinose/galactoside ABC-type transport system permease subunit
MGDSGSALRNNSRKVRLFDKHNRNVFFEKFGTLLILLSMVLVMSILKPSFLSLQNFTNIIRQQTPIAIMALGITFTIISGGIDISGGSVIALSAVVLATFGKVSDAGIANPLIVPIITSLAVGGLAGLINGSVISFGNVPPFIVTLGMMSMARGGALIVSKGRPITGFTEAFEFIGSGSVFGIPFPMIILIISFLFAYVLLHMTKFGTYVFAIGSSQTAAEVSGIKVRLVKTSIYVLAGLFTGIAAIVLASRTLSGQPGVGQSWEMQAITCAIIGGTSFSGGKGSIIGTIIGSLIMGVLANSMTMLQIAPAVQMVVRGGVIVLAVLIDERKHRYKR